MTQILQILSRWAIPFLLLAVPVWGLCRRVKIYEVFVAGAREGLRTGLRIAPYLLGMLVAIGIFRQAGGVQLIVGLLKPLTGALGIPPEVLPLGLMRPLSGSGSLGLLADLLDAHGPDSPIGLIASVVQGSTETTFYVLTVYLGAVGLTRPRHTWAAGLTADLVAFLTAVILAGVFF